MCGLILVPQKRDCCMENDVQCPCGTGYLFKNCCQAIHSGERNAASAEELMRSRYSANVLKDVSYLLRTWHPEKRPEGLDVKSIPDWTSLEIIRTEGGLQGDRHGLVEFKAVAFSTDAVHLLHEISHFEREKEQWYYVKGDIIEAQSDVKQGKIMAGRNDQCPCGSGKKFKKCCRA